jgi:hypothetical protein
MVGLNLYYSWSHYFRFFENINFDTYTADHWSTTPGNQFNFLVVSRSRQNPPLDIIFVLPLTL